MGGRDYLRRLLGPVSAVPELARADRVSALVPPDARYVTVGLYAIVPDGLVGHEPLRGPYRREFGALPNAEHQPQLAGLLMLAGDRLSVMSEAGEQWSAHVEDLTDLDAHRQSGFVIVTRGTDNLVMTTQGPVETPPGASFRTVPRMTNMMSGWDKILEPYGVHVHW
jgi:hypothetical protein